LYQAYRYFPKKTVFVVVVDPGVGSKRKPILVETRDYFFVGPDNGVLTMALEEQRVRRVIHLTQAKYFLHPVSRTFHGRDIFAPVAAHLAKGVSPARFGKALSAYSKLPEFLPRVRSQEILGTILSVDRFGSALTNLRKDFLLKFFPQLDFRVFAGRRGSGPLHGVRTHYAEGSSGKPFLLFSSSDLLEICVNQGSAAALLKIKQGDSIRIPRKKSG
jgi:S-adenosylmethionine hydrolase